MEKLPNQQQQHMIDMLTTLRSGKEADVQLVCGDREYPAHKLILKINSPYFVAMFNSGLEECKSGKVHFAQMEPSTLESVLDFLYFGKVDCIKTRLELESVLKASHMMQLNKLFLYCCEALLKLVSPDYFMQLLTIAEKYEKNEMVKVILDYLIINQEKIFASHDYLHASHEQVRCLIACLGNKSTCMDNVLKGVLNWLTQELDFRDKYAEDLLKFVDPTLITKKNVIELLADKQLMTSSSKICNKLKEVAMMVLTSESCPVRLALPNADKEFKKIIFFSDSYEEVRGDERSTNSITRNNFEMSNQYLCRNASNFSSSRRYFNCVQGYDLQTGSWLPVSFLVFGGFKGVAICQYGQNIYMVGGPMGSNCNKCDGNGELLEVFNTNLPRTMDSGLCAFQGHLFLVGGLNTKSESLPSVYYSTNNMSIWCEDQRLNNPRSSPTVIASSEYLYVTGGNYTEKFSWPIIEYTRIAHQPLSGPYEKKLEPWTLINLPQTPTQIHSVVIQDKLRALHCVKQNLVVMEYVAESSKWLVKTFPLPIQDTSCQPLSITHAFPFPNDHSKQVFVSSTFNHGIPNYTIELSTGKWSELVEPQGVCAVLGATGVCSNGN